MEILRNLCQYVLKPIWFFSREEKINSHFATACYNITKRLCASNSRQRNVLIFYSFPYLFLVTKHIKYVCDLVGRTEELFFFSFLHRLLSSFWSSGCCRKCYICATMPFNLVCADFGAILCKFLFCRHNFRNLLTTMHRILASILH